MTEGTRLVLELTGRHPVAIIARRCEVGLSTVYGWTNGVRPCLAHRHALWAVYGVPLEAWRTTKGGAE